MSFTLAISFAILFLITIIIYITYLACSGSAPPPPLQAEHDFRTEPEQDLETGPELDVEAGPEHNAETDLDNAMLRSWPKLSYAEAKLQHPRAAAAGCCSLCFDDYEEEEEEEVEKPLRLLPECGHLFHAKCAGPWLLRYPTCPVCRSVVVINGALADNIQHQIGQAQT